MEKEGKRVTITCNLSSVPLRGYQCLVYVIGILFLPLQQIGERQEALILKFNAPPPTHLVCNDHLIANFLSFHMSLVVVVNCGAGNALRGFEISMF